MSIASIANTLGVSAAKSKRLIEEAEQARDLEQYKLDSIPVKTIRDLFDQRQEEDPTLTQAKLARAAGMRRIDLRRAIGLSPTPARTVNGKQRPGWIQSEITVAMASRIVRALGIAPHEIPGL